MYPLIDRGDPSGQFRAWIATGAERACSGKDRSAEQNLTGFRQVALALATGNTITATAKRSAAPGSVGINREPTQKPWRH